MKRLILKTALITLFSAICLVVLVMVIVCYTAPRAMMNFTASMGMESASGTFAYREYEKSGDLDCLTRAFLIAEKHGDDETALERWELLYADAHFADYCAAGAPKDEEVEDDELPAYSYYDYLAGCAARVKYRLAKSDAEKDAVLEFALGVMDGEHFPAGNPVIALAAEARGDADFLSRMRERLEAEHFEKNDSYLRLMEALEGTNA